MLEEDFEREIKVLLVGNGGVGKTSMIRRFCKGVFTDEYKKTIGVDFLEKTIYVDELGEDVRMMLWDTAGQEEFDSMTRTYYRGAGACVVVFSTTDRESFEAVPGWKAKVEAECGSLAMVLVQNKVDLLEEATMTPEEAEAMARKVGLKFYRSCVKENMNVTE
ncbi:Ras-related protein Rab-23, partial [Cymbomonas tetramitiformis]